MFVWIIWTNSLTHRKSISSEINFDASAADDFWKHTGKRWNCSKYVCKWQTVNTCISLKMENLLKTSNFSFTHSASKLYFCWLSHSITWIFSKQTNFKPFQHTPNLQQTTLKTWLLAKSRIISINEGIITAKSWKHCDTMFSKVVCCRGIRKRLYVGKG